MPDEDEVSYARKNVTTPSGSSARFGDFLFTPSTGELFSAPEGAEGTEGCDGCDGSDGSEPTLVRRLAPQPAQLLALLLQREGALLLREEIRTELWPDVEVDFDQSLHFCVRQLRSALGDTAGSPKYIETLPRRGYRLKPEVTWGLETVPSAGPREAGGSEKLSPNRPPWLLLVLATLGLAAATVLLLTQRTGSTQPDVSATAPPAEPARSAEVTRLAIMTFEAPVELDIDGDPAIIALHLLSALSDVDPERLVVIGPATTGRYESDLRDVFRLTQELTVDYVMNGRFVESEDGTPQMLAELIRANDGAHLWVKLCATSETWGQVAIEIESAIRTELELSTE